MNASATAADIRKTQGQTRTSILHPPARGLIGDGVLQGPPPPLCLLGPSFPSAFWPISRGPPPKRLP